jgi:hypothetical protein
LSLRWDAGVLTVHERLCEGRAGGHAARRIGGGTTGAPVGRIKKITPDERRELEQKIDAARAARGHVATSAGERPHLPPAKGGLESLPPGAFELLNQALPYLGACYGNGPRISGSHGRTREPEIDANGSIRRRRAARGGVPA